VNARYDDPEVLLMTAIKTDGNRDPFRHPVASATAQQGTDAASGD
jgi:hypothetical protein